METIPIGISVSTPKGEIVELNQVAINMFGFSTRQEFETTPADDLYYNPDDRAHFVELHKTGLVKDFEVQMN